MQDLKVYLVSHDILFFSLVHMSFMSLAIAMPFCHWSIGGYSLEELREMLNVKYFLGMLEKGGELPHANFNP